MAGLKSIFDQTPLKKLTLPNRLFRAAVGDRSPDGQVGEENLALYEKLARGGVGTILTGFTRVSAKEDNIFPIFALYDDSFLPGHRRLTELVHSRGALIFSQQVYVGSRMSKVFPDDASPEKREKTLFLSPSGTLPGDAGAQPREITAAEIAGVGDDFAGAAVRAKEAGYDGVEIHAAHGFLFSQFLTPLYNRRTDEYGGSWENRSRIVAETYGKVRAAVGPDFPILLKINARESGGQPEDLGDILAMAAKLDDLGLDGLEISGDWWEFSKDSPAYFLSEATRIAEKIKGAVILTGGLRTPGQMDQILNSTGIRYFGLARPLIADPGLVNKFKGR